MKTKNKLLSSILCLLILTLCVVGLSSCDMGKKCSHEWSDWKIAKKATCMEAQTEKRTCDKCGVTETKTTGDVVDHKDDDTDHVCDFECGEEDMGKHQDSTKDKDHDCDYCGEVIGECTYPEGSSICDVCGKDKNAPKPQKPSLPSLPSLPSKPSIGEKPNISYIDLFNSTRNANKLAIKVQNFSLVAKYADTSDISGSITQNGDIEIELSIENEKIEGAGTGSAVIFNGPIPNENVDCKFDAIIDGENIYIDLDIGEETTGIKMAVDSILNGYSASINNPTDVTEFINDTLLPTVDLLMLLNSEAANDFLGDVYNMFYSFEKQSNGSYIAKLDYNKLKSLNELLATTPASEVIDMYFGENTVKILVAFSEQILDLEPSEIPAYLDANRVDSDKIIDAINKLFATMEDVPEGFDIEDMLNSKEFEGYTLGMLLFGTEDNSYTDLFDEFVNSLNEKSIYELYYPENANELKDNINKTLDTYAETFSISLIINRSGELVSENCNINNFTYNDGYNEGTISFNMDIIYNDEIDVTWSDIVKDINKDIVLPDKEMLKEEISAYAYEGGDGFVMYQGEEYSYSDGIYVNANKPLYDKLNAVMYTPQVDNWTMYMVSYAQKAYSFTLATIEVDGNEVALIVNEFSGEVVELVETSSGFKAIFENGNQKSFTFNFDDYEESDDAYVALFFAVFEDPEGIESAMGANLTYRYNSKLEEFEIVE